MLDLLTLQGIGDRLQHDCGSDYRVPCCLIICPGHTDSEDDKSRCQRGMHGLELCSRPSQAVTASLYAFAIITGGEAL